MLELNSSTFMNGTFILIRGRTTWNNIIQTEDNKYIQAYFSVTVFFFSFHSRGC
jgi:hypothetical protein